VLDLRIDLRRRVGTTGASCLFHLLYVIALRVFGWSGRVRREPGAAAWPTALNVSEPAQPARGREKIRDLVVRLARENPACG
jgi:hypothetical protein